jgi:hypothetical protein
MLLTGLVALSFSFSRRVDKTDVPLNQEAKVSP